MKYSYNWLKELSQTKFSPEKVVENLTMHSLEVEGLEHVGTELENVVVGRILEIKKHPNADKLQIATVDVGKPLTSPPTPLLTKERGVLQIVCGASNIAVGQKVPVALVGAKLPGGFEIKEAEIRGVKSFGMLCAPDELGLGTDHSGIMILDSKAKIGTPLAEFLKLEDSILEIKVLPDRAHDCLSHVGLAREIAVLERRELDYDFDGLKIAKADLIKANKKQLKIEIKDKMLCRRYIGAVMNGIEIKESPMWMQSRLKACGMKPINNVVDATNYVMLELGQPLHAFDFSKIKSEFPISNFQFPNKSKISNPKIKKAEIVVRRAKKDEKMQLLDDTEIMLTENDLLITNGDTPLALAGIMGGKDSGIDESTKTIVLEAASFDAVNIRKTRTRLNIKTESSDRFEKDIDSNLTEKAMVRVIEILEHIAGGKLEEIVDVYPKKVNPWKIKLDLNYVNSLLGEVVPEKEVITILKLLGIQVKSQKSKVKSASKNSKVIECEMPTFRVDLRTQEDLIEEIGRVWGYEKIQPRPIEEKATPVSVNEQLRLERKIREQMIGLGFSEVYNYSFYSEMDVNNCGLGNIQHLELANPMNPEQQYVRVSLIPNILKNVRENLKHFSDFEIFEVGRSYHLCHPELGSGSRNSNPQIPDQVRNDMVKEERTLVMAKVARESKNEKVFYELKGDVEDLLESLGINGSSTSIMEVELPLAVAIYHPTRTANIIVRDIIIGKIGEVNPLVLEKYKIKSRVAIAEIDLEKMKLALPKEKIYKPISKFPVVTRDISMLADAKIRVADIIKTIQDTGGNLILEVELFDIFKKENQNSFAYHISFGSSERTLESGEVEELMNKIISYLEKNLKVEVRK